MKLMLTLTICILSFTLLHATEKQAEAIQRNVAIEEVSSVPMTKKNLRKEKRMQKFERLVAKYEAASTEGRIIAAALLAVFLGPLAIHRVYLGGSGWLVLGYLFTFGGLFGILPLIDFIRIVARGTEHYEGNDRLFAAFENIGEYE